MPNTPRGGGISRKITNPGDRKRLKSIIDELEIPEGIAVIVRTGSVDLRTVTPAVIASGLAISRALGWRPTAGVRHPAANP